MNDEERIQEEREHRVHQQQLSAGGMDDDDGKIEILDALSKDVGQDLDSALANDPILGQSVSRLTSTANLTEEQVKSNEWYREIVALFYLQRRPKQEGLHGTRRGFAHADRSEALEPMDPELRARLEAYVSMSKMALTRSEDMTAVQEATHNTQESIVHNDKDSSSGGILGRLK